jgi:hypothetical protein
LQVTRSLRLPMDAFVGLVHPIRRLASLGLVGTTRVVFTKAATPANFTKSQHLGAVELLPCSLHLLDDEQKADTQSIRVVVSRCSPDLVFAALLSTDLAVERVSPALLSSCELAAKNDWCYAAGAPDERHRTSACWAVLPFAPPIILGAVALGCALLTGKLVAPATPDYTDNLCGSRTDDAAAPFQTVTRKCDLMDLAERLFADAAPKAAATRLGDPCRHDPNFTERRCRRRWASMITSTVVPALNRSLRFRRAGSATIVTHRIVQVTVTANATGERDPAAAFAAWGRPNGSGDLDDDEYGVKPALSKDDATSNNHRTPGGVRRFRGVACDDHTPSATPGDADADADGDLGSAVKAEGSDDDLDGIEHGDDDAIGNPCPEGDEQRVRIDPRRPLWTQIVDRLRRTAAPVYAQDLPLTLDEPNKALSMLQAIDPTVKMVALNRYNDRRRLVAFYIPVAMATPADNGKPHAAAGTEVLENISKYKSAVLAAFAASGHSCLVRRHLQVLAGNAMQGHMPDWKTVHRAAIDLAAEGRVAIKTIRKPSAQREVHNSAANDDTTAHDRRAVHVFLYALIPDGGRAPALSAEDCAQAEAAFSEFLASKRAAAREEATPGGADTSAKKRPGSMGARQRVHRAASSSASSATSDSEGPIAFELLRERKTVQTGGKKKHRREGASASPSSSSSSDSSSSGTSASSSADSDADEFVAESSRKGRNGAAKSANNRRALRRAEAIEDDAIRQAQALANGLATAARDRGLRVYLALWNALLSLRSRGDAAAMAAATERRLPLATALGSLPLSVAFACLGVSQEPGMLDVGGGVSTVDLGTPIDRLRPSLAASIVHPRADELMNKLVSVLRNLKAWGLIDLTMSSAAASDTPAFAILKVDLPGDLKGRWPATTIDDAPNVPRSSIFSALCAAFEARYPHLDDDLPKDQQVTDTTQALFASVFAAVPCPSGRLACRVASACKVPVAAVLRASYHHNPAASVPPSDVELEDPTVRRPTQRRWQPTGDESIFGALDDVDTPIRPSQHTGAGLLHAAASQNTPQHGNITASVAEGSTSSHASRQARIVLLAERCRVIARRSATGGREKLTSERLIDQFVRGIPEMLRSGSRPATIVKAAVQASRLRDPRMRSFHMLLVAAADAVIEHRAVELDAAITSSDGAQDEHQIEAAVQRLADTLKACYDFPTFASQVAAADGGADRIVGRVHLRNPVMADRHVWREHDDASAPHAVETLDTLTDHAARQAFQSLLYTPETRFSYGLGAFPFEGLPIGVLKKGRAAILNEGVGRRAYTTSRMGCGMLPASLNSLQRAEFGDRPGAAYRPTAGRDVPYSTVAVLAAERAASTLLLAAGGGSCSSGEGRATGLGSASGVGDDVDALCLGTGGTPLLPDEEVLTCAPTLQSLFQAGGAYHALGLTVTGSADEAETPASADHGSAVPVREGPAAAADDEPSRVAPPFSPRLGVAGGIDGEEGPGRRRVFGIRSEISATGLPPLPVAQAQRFQAPPALLRAAAHGPSVIRRSDATMESALLVGLGRAVFVDGRSDVYAARKTGADELERLRHPPPPFGALATLHAPPPRGVTLRPLTDEQSSQLAELSEASLRTVPLHTAISRASHDVDLARSLAPSLAVGGSAAPMRAPLTPDPRAPGQPVNRSALREVSGALHKELIGAVAGKIYDAVLAQPGTSIAELSSRHVGSIVSVLDVKRVVSALVAAGAFRVRRQPGSRCYDLPPSARLEVVGAFVDPYECTDL